MLHARMNHLRAVVSRLFPSALLGWILVIVCRLGYVELRAHATTTPLIARELPEWRSLIAGRRPTLGTNGADVIILEFSDYQCPYCGIMEPRLQQLVSRHPGRIAVYRFDLPRETIHPYAKSAAVAADCAALQDVDEPYQEELFNNQRHLANFNWVDLAKRSGVKDIGAFTKCIDDQEPLAAIKSDLNTGERLQINGTPTLIINGAMVDGAMTSEDLNDLYRRASR